MSFPSKTAERSCVGCRCKKKANLMARLVLEQNGAEIFLRRDEKGTCRGRGAWLCLDSDGLAQTCLDLAFKKKAFNRAFKCSENLKML